MQSDAKHQQHHADLSEFLRQLDVGEDDGRRVAFSSGAMARDGRYDRETGEVSYTAQQLPSLLEKLNALHKTGSGSPLHWFSVVYGVLLTFLAVSSLWMFKPATRPFRRGLVLAGVGFAAAAALSCVDYLGEVPWSDDDTTKAWYTLVKTAALF